MDYVSKVSGQQKLFLIGHSMGSLVAYILLALKPQYNDRVKLLVSLAPAAVFTHLFQGPFNKFMYRFGTQVVVS